MPSATLQDRALIRVTGPDAEHFLQNILTTDLDQLKQGVARPGALLAPQGKILFDFLISRIEDGFILECRADIADDFMRRLTLYRLRAKAEISKPDQSLVSVTWQNDSGPSQTDSSASHTESKALVDTRFADGVVKRTYGGTADAGNGEAWRAFRIANGVAESGNDYQLGDAFPHDVLLDQNGGVGFRKGCYIGQEVVSRMQHRGTARRRVLIASADEALPGEGTELIASGRSVGALGAAAGSMALAVARIDKVKQAVDASVPILAGDIAVTLSIPAWATFTFPADAGTEDA